MLKVLVTGVGGFVGRNLAESLTPQYDVSAPTRAELNLLDEDDVRQYLQAHLFDVVIHAATVRANRRIGAPPNLAQQNCRMFFNLARNPGLFGRMLFLNSGAVYDRRKPVARLPETAFDRSVPTDPYGFSKYICAHYVERSDNLYDLRLFGIFGPYEDWEIRFLSNACCRAVWDLPIILKQNVRFDYLDVADLRKLIPWFVEGQPSHRAYNICTGRAIELTALARKIVRASGKDLPVTVLKPGLADEYSGDNHRLLAEMPDFQFTAMDHSIDRLFRWYQARKAEIDPERLHFDDPAVLPLAAGT